MDTARILKQLKLEIPDDSIRQTYLMMLLSKSSGSDSFKGVTDSVLLSMEDMFKDKDGIFNDMYNDILREKQSRRNNKLESLNLKSMKRFEFNANNMVDASHYIYNRAIQLLKYGVKLKSMDEVGFGVDATFIYNGEEYHGIYILEEFRGKKLYDSYVKTNDYKVITHIDCQIEDYLKKHNIEYVCLGEFEQTPEYKWMQSIYGDDRAKRSDVYFMNHVDEGLAVLEWIGASDVAKRAYTLHPIFQSDEDLKNNYNADYKDIDAKVIVASMEYRSVANEYLSTRSINDISEIRLSPLKDVNDMLIADKVQNYKDFEQYHMGKHIRSIELNEYFINWLMKLGVRMNYEKWKRDLQIKF
jgi:hypothetical protein